MRNTKRVLNRLRNSDRQKLIRAKAIKPYDEELEDRKRIEKMWEESIYFFEKGESNNQ